MQIPVVISDEQQQNEPEKRQWVLFCSAVSFVLMYCHLVLCATTADNMYCYKLCVITYKLCE